MNAHTFEELEKYRDKDFLDNSQAFKAGRTNDDMVDFCCICFALGHTPESTRVLIKLWFDKFHIKDSERNRIREHYDRIEDWLMAKEDSGYVRGKTDIMVYAINY